MAAPYLSTTPTRMGENAATGVDPRELFLKVFGGMTITSFNEANVMMPLHQVRTISSGKTAQFPRVGRATASYHTPGENVFTAGVDTSSPADGFADSSKYLNNIAMGEKTISIDELLIAPVFIPNIDEAMTHFDVKADYAQEMGYALSETADKNLIRTVIAGARALTDDFGTTVASAAAKEANRWLGGVICIDGIAGATESSTSLTTDTTVTGGAQIVAGFFKAAELMDKKNIPQYDRVAVLPPSIYYKLINENKDAINRDYGNDGNGSVARGEIVSVAGIRIYKSNHVPQTDESAASNVHNSAGVKNDVFGSGGVGYGQANFSKTCGIIFQKSAVGTVKLMDLSMEMEYDMDIQGTKILGKYAMGHGILRNECCFELVDNSGVLGNND